jgi:hypothetical protein
VPRLDERERLLERLDHAVGAASRSAAVSKWPVATARSEILDTAATRTDRIGRR